MIVYQVVRRQLFGIVAGLIVAQVFACHVGAMDDAAGGAGAAAMDSVQASGVSETTPDTQMIEVLQNFADYLLPANSSEEAMNGLRDRLFKIGAAALISAIVGAVAHLQSLGKPSGTNNMVDTGKSAAIFAVVGLGALGLYEGINRIFIKDKHTYTEILMSIFRQWDAIKALIPEAYFDELQQLYLGVLQNGFVLPISEKEAKLFVYAIKHDIRMKEKMLQGTGGKIYFGFGNRVPADAAISVAV